MADKANDGSVLILAPLGRDGPVANGFLAQAEIDAVVCDGLASLVAQLDSAPCAVITEEALLGSDRRSLAGWINLQPPWSDFPFILLTVRGSTPDPRLPELLGNVTVLERPFHPDVLVNAVRSGIRARRRQREVEMHLAERQRTQERQSLLIRELHHRVKNTLANVQGLLGATARSSQDIGEFYRSFSNRIVSLSQTHSLLTEDYWQTAQLDLILKNELEPYGEAAQRVLLSGPVVELSADIAVPTGMAFHELTTNSVKYGALSSPEGRIEVRWNVNEGETGRRVHISWTERNGPPVESPKSRGFGSALIERVLAQQCNADVQLRFAPEGVQFTMDAPLVSSRLVPDY